jgi:hypothetical protein
MQEQQLLETAVLSQHDLVILCSGGGQREDQREDLMFEEGQDGERNEPTLVE